MSGELWAMSSGRRAGSSHGRAFLCRWAAPQGTKSITTNNQQPTTNNQQPTTNNQQPTTNNQQPTTNNQQPTTNNQQPTTNNQQPTTNNQHSPFITDHSRPLLLPQRVGVCFGAFQHAGVFLSDRSHLTVHGRAPA